MTVFQTERYTLNTEYQKNLNYWTGAIAGALMCLAVPTILAEATPKSAKTLFLSAALAGAGASAHAARNLNSRTRRHHIAMEKAADQVLERAIVNESLKAEAVQALSHQSELEGILAMLERNNPQQYHHYRAYLEQEGYIAPLPQQPAYQTIATTAQQMPSHASVNGVGAIAHQPTYAQPQHIQQAAQPQPIGRSTTAPNLGAIADPVERMTVLLQAMSNEGFPLGTLINHPFVWCWGRSQSGKTTIALMLAIARQVLGHNVSYFTTDDDYPRNLPWAHVSDTPDEYAIALDTVRDIIAGAGKGSLKGNSWIFDEMLAAHQEHGLEIQPLLVCVLMKLAKTKGGIISISQANTSKAHGIEGLDSAWQEERVSLNAIHAEDVTGNRTPTGRYIVEQGGDTTEWKIPSWMYSDNNEWGVPDPAVWMSNRFPELNPGQQRSPHHATTENVNLQESDRTGTEEEKAELKSAYKILAERNELKLATEGAELTDAELQQGFYQLTEAISGEGLWVDDVNLSYVWTLVNAEANKAKDEASPTDKAA